MLYPVKDQQEATGRDWSDTSGRFPADALLRRHGFRIVSRRPGEEALWHRPGMRGPVGQARALEISKREGGSR